MRLNIYDQEIEIQSNINYNIILFYKWTQTKKDYPLNKSESQFITKIIESDIDYSASR